MIDEHIENESNQITSIIQSFKKSITYTWESEGKELLADLKTSLNAEEKQILSALLVLESPTSHQRRKMWFISSGAKREMQNNPNYYTSLLTDYPSTLTPSSKAIDLDIHRTFSHEDYFHNETILTSLRNVLIALSRRYTSIGYCQGFNFIVARILQVANGSEEETFWLFVQVIEKYLQLNYYTDLSGLMIDCVIVSRIITNMFPDVMDKLIKGNLDISLTNYIFKSLLCLYAENINEYMFNVIWDVFFLKGDITIFKAILCLIKGHKEKLMALKSMSAINTLFACEMQKFRDKEMMVYYLLLKRYDFSKESIENNREIFFPTLKAQLIKTSSILSVRDDEGNGKDANDGNGKEKVEPSCDVNAPICLKGSKSNAYHTVFVIRQAESKIVIRKQYFFNECKDYPFEKETSPKDNYPSLLIEREVHCCNEHKTQAVRKPSFIRIDSLEGTDYIHSLIKELNS